MTLKPRLNDQVQPLVSVLIFNYNYGQYLRQCFDSVLEQFYDNIEINFSDNASNDESWNIAAEYAIRHPGVFTLTRNRANFGVDANFANCFLNARGKYFVELCSDDAMAPQYISSCVEALETHPEAAFAMVHRDIIDENGNTVIEPPFYNRSCLIPGTEQAAVYMMAAVNPSVSQIMYNKQKTTGKHAHGGIAARWYGTRILDFNICCEYPIIYLKDPLLKHRLHLANDSFHAADNLMEVIGPYVLQHQFADIASYRDGMQKVLDRLPASLEKLSSLCLRYCVRALHSGIEVNALRYFHLSIAISPIIMRNEIFIELQQYWTADAERKTEIVKKLGSKSNLETRSVSYDTPPGSIDLDIFNDKVSLSV